MIPINPSVLRQVNSSMVQDFADSAPVDLEVPPSAGTSHPDPDAADHGARTRTHDKPDAQSRSGL